ncbi:hypothetical protein ATANTOWER_011759 [Ataeniobius toweri]|uniref:Uncharacterized protein n=1 Tax=Ataeniobius toweri TaxID=208326 RepID=A0ABU7C7T9_9TELE|nr:hypothetical protein [Ataeniobius toweri]
MSDFHAPPYLPPSSPHPAFPFPSPHSLLSTTCRFATSGLETLPNTRNFNFFALTLRKNITITQAVLRIFCPLRTLTLGGRVALGSGMGSSLQLHNLDFLLISLLSSLCLRPVQAVPASHP